VTVRLGLRMIRPPSVFSVFTRGDNHFTNSISLGRHSLVKKGSSGTVEAQNREPPFFGSV
jgi:hypothetical protein